MSVKLAVFIVIKNVVIQDNIITLLWEFNSYFLSYYKMPGGRINCLVSLGTLFLIEKQNSADLL